MSYTATFSANARKTSLADGNLFVGGPVFLPLSVPEEYLKTITRFDVEVGCNLSNIIPPHLFDDEAFKFRQAIFANFITPDSNLGSKLHNLDNSDPELLAFQQALDEDLVYNPNNEAEFNNFSPLNATFSARVSLLDKEIRENSGDTFKVLELLENQAVLQLDGARYDFETINTFWYENYQQIDMQVWANITVQATDPID